MAETEEIPSQSQKTDENTGKSVLVSQRGRGYNFKLTAEKLTYLLDVKGLTVAEVADYYQVHTSAIYKYIKRNGVETGALQDFKRHKIDMLEKLQMDIVKNMSLESIKDATLSQQAIAFGVLFDKSRLLQGLSTQNVSFADLTKSFEELRKKREELDKQLGIDNRQTIDVEGGEVTED